MSTTTVASPTSRLRFGLARTDITTHLAPGCLETLIETIVAKIDELI